MKVLLVKEGNTMEGVDTNECNYLLHLLRERKSRLISEIEQLAHINDDDEITSRVSIEDHHTELKTVNNLILKMDGESYLKAV